MEREIVEPDRFLLYIDILGFSNLVESSTYSIDNLYAVLDSLHVHSNKQEYEVIVFSDTVLVYNKEKPVSEKHRKDLLWYLIEYVEELHHRLVGQNLYFRAVIVAGSFSHYELKHINCFYGPALIDAYHKEKDIPSTGVFIDNKSNIYNEFFRTEKYSDELNFVFMNRCLEFAVSTYSDSPPFNDPCFTDGVPRIVREIRYLQDTYKHSISHSAPRVRVKHLMAWSYYYERYPNTLKLLRDTSFSVEALCPVHDWKRELAELEDSILETMALAL